MDMDMNMMEPLGILIMVMVLAVGATIGILVGVRIAAARENRRVESNPHDPPLLGGSRSANPWTEQRLTEATRETPGDQA